MKEVIYHPNHYADGKYECLEVMTDVFGKEVIKDFCVCNAFKYIWRHKKKGGDQDLEKAANYLRIYLGMKSDPVGDLLKDGGFEPVSVDDQLSNRVGNPVDVLYTGRADKPLDYPQGDPLDPVYDRFEG